MPYELSDLISKRVRTVDIDATGDGATVLHVRYSPDAMTPTVWARLQAWVQARGDEQADPFEAAEYVLEPLVRGFSVTEGGRTEPLTRDGKPFPATAEAIAGMGLDLLRAISAAVMADFNGVRNTSGPKGPSGAPSSAPSTPPAASPIGTSP
jgi:hypothetical protein